MSAHAVTAARDYRVMGAIGSAHFLSHFFLLCLPPLFPLIKEEFGVSYAALGLAVTLLNTFTGLGQVPVGFLVDRLGARRLLFVGMFVLSISMGLIGFADSYLALLVLACVGGIGNAVFHPADYAILSASIDERRIGRAFGMHMFGGSFGFAAAPTVMVLLASLWDWRTGLLVAGVAGVVMTGAIWSQSGVMREEERSARARAGSGDPATGEGVGAAGSILFTLPVLLFFLLFTVGSVTSQGLQAFLVSALVKLHGTALAVANSTLTAYLLGTVAGTVVGGMLADRTRRHMLITVVCLVASGGLLLVVGWMAVAALVLTTLMLVVGFLQGLFRPSRDMLVRAITPPGSMGKVFGFVSAGLHVGGTIAPVLFGWIIDLGRPELIFVFLAIILVLACGTLFGTGRPLGPPRHPLAAE